jgi:hypothetical protein
MCFKFLTLIVSFLTICTPVLAEGDPDDLLDERDLARWLGWKNNNIYSDALSRFDDQNPLPLNLIPGPSRYSKASVSADDKGKFKDDKDRFEKNSNESNDPIDTRRRVVTPIAFSDDECDEQDQNQKTLRSPFRVFPVEFPEEIRLPKVESIGIGRGKKLELLDIKLTLADGEEYEFGKDGGEFSHLDPFKPLGNKGSYNFSLCITDNTTKFSTDARPFLANHKGGRKQTLPRVRLTRSRDVATPEINIRYDLESRQFFADGKVPWDWGKINP